MIQDELTKLSEEADNDEDENEDVEKKQPRRRAKFTAWRIVKHSSSAQC